MSDPLRLGIVGCGGISRAHARAAAAQPELARFVTCCDVRAEAARRWAAENGAEQSYSDLEQMLERSDLDAVLIATWPVQHRQHIEMCLRAGVRSILCEKALTLTGDDAMAIWEQAGAAGALLMEAFMYRHHPLTRRIESLLARDEIGTVDNVTANFSVFDPENRGPEDESRDWRQRRECGGGVPYDFLCYPVSGCGHYVGDLPVRVFATGRVSPAYDVIHRMYGMIEYAHGQVGIATASRRSDFSEELQILGADGIIYAQIAWTPPYCPAVHVRRGVNWPEDRRQAYPVEEADPYALQLRNFCRTVQGADRPVMPLVDSVVNTYVLEALVTSLTEGRAVDIRLPDEIARAFTASRRA